MTHLTRPWIGGHNGLLAPVLPPEAQPGVGWRGVEVLEFLSTADPSAGRYYDLRRLRGWPGRARRRWKPGRHPERQPSVDHPMTRRTNCMVPREIHSPGDLADVIRCLASAVRNGDMRQVTPSTTPFATPVDIMAIAPEGPWPDYLELHFEGTQIGNRFSLVAETYHGVGGRWGLSDKPPA